MTQRDTVGLLFTAKMSGVQLDLLAARLGIREPAARAAVARWRQQGYADWAQLGPGGRWVWLTQAGLAACGLPYRAGAPALPRLAHLRAVTSGPGWPWRPRPVMPRRAGTGAANGGCGPGWAAGSRSASICRTARCTGRTGLARTGPVSAGLSRRNSPARPCPETRQSMTEILTRTGDYGCPAAEARVPGRPPRHTRVLYLCSPAARPVVLRARTALGAALAARIEIRALPLEPPGPHPPPHSPFMAPPSLVARGARSSLPPRPPPHSPFPARLPMPPSPPAPRPFGSA